MPVRSHARYRRLITPERTVIFRPGVDGPHRQKLDECMRPVGRVHDELFEMPSDQITEGLDSRLIDHG